MNQFIALDFLFPTLPNRLSGEVISVSVRVSTMSGNKTLSWKRKAWYVNASVNAFHLHRGLCKELSVISGILDISPKTEALLKRFLASATLDAYLGNLVSNDQYFEYNLDVFGSGLPHMTQADSGNEITLESPWRWLNGLLGWESDNKSGAF